MQFPPDFYWQTHPDLVWLLLVTSEVFYQWGEAIAPRTSPQTSRTMTVNSSQQLCNLIDRVAAESGRKVTVTVLKSASKKYRKSAWIKRWFLIVLGKTLNCSLIQTLYYFLTQMFSKEIAIGLLSRASNGDDLLAILDSLAADQDDTQQEEIQFW